MDCLKHLKEVLVCLDNTLINEPPEYAIKVALAAVHLQTAYDLLDDADAAEA